MRIANQTNSELLASIAVHRRFGKPYLTIAAMQEELLDRREAMGYTDPAPATEPETQPATSRDAQINRFIGGFDKPAQEDTDATN